MKKLSGGRGGREERALEKRLLLEASAGVALYVVQKLRLERKKGEQTSGKNNNNLPPSKAI